MNSAQGILCMLDEDDIEIKIYALQKLNLVIDQAWPEAASYLSLLESLASNKSFPQHQLASFVISKVFYHLQEYNQAIKFALDSGHLFDLNESGLFVKTIVNKCIDLYIEQRNDLSKNAAPIDKGLEDVVNRTFERCFTDKTFNHAIGIAIESRRLDIVKRAIVESGSLSEKLNYTYQIAQRTIVLKDYRKEILKTLVDIYQTSAADSNYFNLSQCQFFLDEPEATALLLSSLLQSDDGALTAYQIGFDLVESQNQAFLNTVNGALKCEDYKKVDQLSKILKNEISYKHTLQFLKKNNHTDMLLLKRLQTEVGEKNSITHGALVWANGIMNAATTNDSFLRDNLDWVAKAINWGRFTATSSIGVIHMGNKAKADEVLQPYISGQQDQKSIPFQTGGAYYAYGLIHANQYSKESVEYLTNGFKTGGNDEIIQHGLSLGLGLVSMATGDNAVFSELQNVLFSDSAVAGEAAGLAMGLVKAGTACPESIQLMLRRSQETQHEKIIRSLALGLSLIMYGKEEAADTLILQLIQSKDAILRYGAMFTIGMAYAGTGNHESIRKLLHYAVSDVSDDVRRAAAINMGFLLFKTPERIPEILKLLAESYNPHVRYGVAMALGIGCSGTGNIETLKLLVPLTNDNVDFVRQGALIAMSLIFIQITEQSEPRVKKIKELFEKIYTNKHEEVLAKFGSIIGTGVLNAAGRNATIRLASESGNNQQAAIIGLAVFTHYWYWYPLLHFLSLSLTPTALFGVNQDLKIPKGFNYISNAKPSLFKYPEFLKEEDKKKAERVETVQLSTTATVLRKKLSKGGDMEVDSTPKKQEADKDEPVIKDEPMEGENKPAEDEKKEDATFEILKNPS